MNFVDNQDRNKLCEGRNFGLGFAFCKKTHEGVETVMPITTCKDFLNDVVFSEITEKPHSIYGLKTEKLGIFGSKAYVALKILGYKNGSKHSHFDVEAKQLNEIEQNAALLLWHFEDKLRVPRTVFNHVNDSVVVAEICAFWCNGTYLISLWSLLIRVGLSFDNTKSPEAFLAKITSLDAYMAKAALVKINKMLYECIPAQNFPEGFRPHNCGIVSFDFDNP